MNPKVPEILAPAGGREQFFAALNAGADSVYLGMKSFNARARAGNFSLEDLAELKPIADRYGMKILVAVNILVKQAELGRLIELLEGLEQLDVHAIIVQDLAVAALVREHFPRIRLHASTQLAVHNHHGVIEAARLGFRRVVLARELTAQELRLIRAQIGADPEIEVFCHGSLCYSYSGLCFFSGAGDGRSGNRGECAYTCRQPYKLISEPGHGFLFSMRDLDTSAHLDLMIKAGVDALKIEGRKKDAQYVSSVVQLYRQRLDQVFGRSTLRPEAPRLKEQGDPVQDLALSFQRRSTSFFVAGRYHENVIDLDNPTHQGLRLGTVSAVNGRAVTFTTAEGLERFDGLRIDQRQEAYHAAPQHGGVVESSPAQLEERYANKLCQFSVRNMSTARHRVFTAAPGSEVTVECPEDSPLPKTGDVVWKVRSQDLKRRTEALSRAPEALQVKPLLECELDATIVSDGEDLQLSVAVARWGVPLAAAAVRVAKVAAATGQALGEELHRVFAVLWEARVKASVLRVAGDGPWFVPRSELKALKRLLVAELQRQVPAYHQARADRALAAVRERLSPLPLRGLGDRGFVIKCDRLETLELLAAYCQQHPEWPLREIVFEPKRAFLGMKSAEDLVGEIQAMAQGLGVALRLAIPAVVRGWDEAQLRRWLSAFDATGGRRYELANIGGIEILRRWELLRDNTDLAGDFTLYCLNSSAVKALGDLGLKTVTLSIEDDRDNLAGLLKAWPSEDVCAQAILFKDTPLFIAEACSLTALHNGCPTAKVCGYRTLEIENTAGERFFVAHESCKSIVYGKRPYAIVERQEELLALGVRQFRIDFLTRPYTAEGLHEVLDAAIAASPLADTHAANFNRTLL